MENESRFQNAVFGAGAPKTNTKKSIRITSPARGRQGAPVVDLVAGRTLQTSTRRPGGTTAKGVEERA
jgi:hypothetical protein